MSQARSVAARGNAGRVAFGFIIHPPTLADVRRVVPATRLLPDRPLLALMRRYPPYVSARIRHLRSSQGHEVEGRFIICPLLPRQMLDLDERLVMDRVVRAARLAERLGAGIVGLGGYTAIVGDKGLTLARRVGIAVTSGNALTAWSAVEAVRRLAAGKGLDIAGERLAVIGATGSVGALCAKKLAGEASGIIITARRRERLAELSSELVHLGATGVEVETDARRAIARARLVITTTSAPYALFDIADLLPGAIVVDVSVPKNVSARGNPRADVTVVEGGRIRLPAGVEFFIDLDLPAGVVHACMAETMALALDGRHESFSLGDRVDPARVDEIGAIAAKHGFGLYLSERR